MILSKEQDWLNWMTLEMNGVLLKHQRLQSSWIDCRSAGIRGPRSALLDHSDEPSVHLSLLEEYL